MTTQRSRFIILSTGLIVAALSLTACGSSMNEDTMTTPTATAKETAAAGHTHAIGDGVSATAGTYTLEVLAVPAAKSEGQLSFKITDGGANLTDFLELHTKKLHLIAVSEDLSDFIHAHPEMSADGVWDVSLTLPEGGKWRIYTDFGTTTVPNGVILGSVIDVPGASTLTPLEAPAATFSSEGFDFIVSGQISATSHGMLMISVTKDGKNVEFEDYLGASGHLVAIREEDGAYAHFHPQGHDHGSMLPATEVDGSTATTNSNDMEMGAGMGSSSMMSMPGMIHFDTEVPGAGKYRLFLQFMAEGELHQVAFTADVA
jgi:hypothetical protein